MKYNNFFKLGFLGLCTALTCITNNEIPLVVGVSILVGSKLDDFFPPINNESGKLKFYDKNEFLALGISCALSLYLNNQGPLVVGLSMFLGSLLGKVNNKEIKKDKMLEINNTTKIKNKI